MPPVPKPSAPQHSVPLPSLFRSSFAVIFGFIVMIVAVIPMTLIAVKLFGLRSGHPTPGYLAYNVLANLIAAFAGGYVTGLLAPAPKQIHGLILGLVMVIMATLSYARYTGAQPGWYRVLLIALPALVAVAGATAASAISPATREPTPATRQPKTHR